MKNIAINKSSFFTLIVVALSVFIVYGLIFELFVNFAPCAQKQNSSFSFEIMFSCIDNLINITLIYLAICSFILFLIKNERVFNKRGIIYSRIFVILLFISFAAMDIFNFL